MMMVDPQKMYEYIRFYLMNNGAVANPPRPMHLPWVEKVNI